MHDDYLLFVRVVEAGSLSAAGRSLSISPAMVSKRLARLEERLGVRLLHRTTRKLALTEVGEGFHDDVTAILHAIRTAEARASGVQDEPAGVLRVSAPTSFGRLHVAPYLHDFLQRYPRVELELDLTDAMVDMVSGRADLAVRITDDVPLSCESYRLGESRRLLCASPSYLAEHGVPDTLSSLSRHRLLAATGQMPWRLFHGSQRRTVDAKSHVITNSSEIVRELAISGVGIALRSYWDVGDVLASGQLVPVLLEWGGSNDLGIYAIHPRMPSVPSKIMVFIDHLKQSLDPPPWQAVQTA